MKNYRFTLIEMVVTITLITMISTLLSPQIRKAISKSREIICQKNILEQYRAVMTYADQSADRLPYTSSFQYEWWWNRPPASPIIDQYYDDILGDMVEPHSYICPGISEDIYQRETLNEDITYRYNSFYASGWYYGNMKGEGHSLHQIEHPSEAKFAFDLSWYNWGLLDTPHDGINMGNMDGHISHKVFIEINERQFFDDVVGTVLSEGWGERTFTPLGY